ncbi:MAG: DUF2892 domain-containing protein [Ignavibacteria bacterium]|nr:DUF2892 domain-containing protein [Ignavibacteria bacterium]
MKKNMGSFDRTLRIILAIVLAILIALGHLKGLSAYIFGVLAVVFLISGLIGVCPIYYPFRINTAKGEQKD